MTDYTIRRYPTVSDEFLPQHVPPLLRQIYARRGVSDERELSLKAAGLTHFSSLKDIDAAVEILADAVCVYLRRLRR